VREKYGDKFSSKTKGKHRYVYFSAVRKEKKELLIKLNYKGEKYLNYELEDGVDTACLNDLRAKC
jgi:hypothetical protein